jgi:adenosylcobinamide kinase/adenosylcobinamide-phosphate guanylyltransferase
LDQYGSKKVLILPKLTLITGGAASGKSLYAEQLVVGTGLPKIYFATAQIWDDEMMQKVRLHQEMRGDGWKTIETGPDLAAAISAAPPDEAVLIDCATMWLTALIMAERQPEDEIPAVLDAIQSRLGPTVIVTNEVGQGIVPDTAMGRSFRNTQGRFNQRVAQRADSVIAVMSGLPLALKGPLPEVMT